jgi:hypothetical protein
MSSIIEMLDTLTGEKKYAGRIPMDSRDEMVTFKTVMVVRRSSAAAPTMPWFICS